MNETDYPAEYVAARAVLLDALVALEHHLPAIIVVGAQAVYLHTGAGEFVEPPMTTDGDLALDVAFLGVEPDIVSALTNADFRPGRNPGSWLGAGEVAVDIMVIPSQSGRDKKGARAARLPGHGEWTARITPGLEPAVVDHGSMMLTALDPSRSAPSRGQRRGARGTVGREGHQDRRTTGRCQDGGESA